MDSEKQQDTDSAVDNSSGWTWRDFMPTTKSDFKFILIGALVVWLALGFVRVFILGG